MENNWLIYAGVLFLVFYLTRFIMANRSVERKIAQNIQEVVNKEEFKVKGRFE